MRHSSILATFGMPAARVSPVNNNNNNTTTTKRPPLQKCGESTSSDCPSLQEIPEDERKPSEKLTPYQGVSRRLQCDQKWQKEITLGRRIGFYRMKEELGTGNFSQVKAAVHALTKERVAVKILDKAKLDQKTQRMLAREISSMESLHHPHVIRLYEVLETLSKIYLVMEYARGGELFHRISSGGQFTEPVAKPLFAQITAAVDHMHCHNIVHRDLKAENVFFAAPNVVKVGDFGFSTHLRDIQEPLRTFCGSPPYAAPELFRDDNYVGPMVDIWAMGVLLYFMLTATMPFKAQTVAALKKQILEGDYVIPDFLSSDCHFLIKGILKQDPKSRITLTHVKRSNWLSDQTLPEALPKQDMVDENGLATLSLDVLSATARLRELGITDVMISEAKEKGCRSNVTGTYRIILHTLQSQPTKEESASVSSSGSPQFLKNKTGGKRFKISKNKKSRLCCIL